MILDGTLLPIDRIAADRPFYSGKHKKHGMNVQVIADPKGRLLWASPALPGAVHDVRAARENAIIEALTDAGINCWAGKGNRGAAGTVRTPYWGRWETSPQAGGRSISLTQRSGPLVERARRHPQVLAAPPQAVLLDHPHHKPRPGHPRPVAGQLRLSR